MFRFGPNLKLNCWHKPKLNNLGAVLMSFTTLTVGWVVGKLESNAKLNSKLRLKLKLKLEVSLAKIFYIEHNLTDIIPF